MPSARTFLFSVLLVGSFLGQHAAAATQAAIKVEQLSSSQLGTWTLISPDGTTRTSNDPGVNKNSFSFGQTDFGQLTLTVTPPAGMSVKISTYRGGELVESKDVQQLSVTLYPNDNYRFLIQYSLSKVGILGVTSDPSGIRFRLRGPTGRSLGSTSPHTFTNLPAGRYAVLFPATESCLQPPRHMVIVEAGERKTVHVTFNCEVQSATSTVDTTRKSKREIQAEVEAREQKPIGERK